MSENIVDDYGWNSSERPLSFEYILPQILKILEKLNVSRILDLGSGNGKLCAELKNNGYNCIGVELDAKGVQIARMTYPQIRFYNFGVQNDPLELLEKESYFDAVVSTEVVEHLFSPHLLPSYAKAVLKNKGHLIITTPYHGFLKNLCLSLLNKWDSHHTALWHGGHIKFWSRNTLSKLLENNGFAVRSFSGVGRAPFLWKSMVLVAEKNSDVTDN